MKLSQYRESNLEMHRKVSLLEIPGMVVGFILSIIGVLLPWQGRIAFSHLLMFCLKKSLRSKAITNFVMNKMFSTEAVLQDYRDTSESQRGIDT